MWLATADQKQLARKQQANLAKLTASRSSTRKVLHIDLRTRQTSIEVVDDLGSTDETEEDDTPSEVRMNDDSQKPTTTPVVTQPIELRYVGSSSAKEQSEDPGVFFSEKSR
jgi:hypothetical protein